MADINAGDAGSENTNEGGSVLDGGGAGASSQAPSGPGGEASAGAPSVDWMMEHLSPDNRVALGPKNLESVDALSAAYLRLEGKIGEKGFMKPAEGAPAEEFDAFYKALGRPDDAGEYAFSMREGVEASESDLAFQGAMGPILHRAGLSQDQVSVLSEGWNAFNAQAAETYSKTMDEQFLTAETALKQEHGAAYQAKMDAGNHAIRQLGGDDLADYLAESGMGRDVRFLNFVIKAGESLSGDGVLVEGGGAVGAINAPGGAKAEITRLKSDPDFLKVFTDPHHAEYSAAVEKMQRLAALANPSPQG